MTQEALKLALDALEVATTPLAKDRQEVLRAITAIKEALAQTQEPVAMWDGKYQIEFGNLSAYKHGEHSWIPLYTSPPQRTWVGLTDEDICMFSMWLDDKSDVAVFTAIEAKLKERNNGV